MPMSLAPTPSSYTRNTSSNDLTIASELLKARQYDTAQELILTYLDFHPHDEAAIYLLALLFEEQRRPGAAANILAGLAETSERWEVHHRYGMVLDDLHLGSTPKLITRKRSSSNPAAKTCCCRWLRAALWRWTLITACTGPSKRYCTALRLSVCEFRWPTRSSAWAITKRAGRTICTASAVKSGDQIGGMATTSNGGMVRRGHGSCCTESRALATRSRSCRA